MRSFRSENIVRWLTAAGIALGGVALTASNSQAFQRYFSEILASNGNCWENSQGYVYYTDSWAFKSNGAAACTVGASLQVGYYSGGVGSTAETVCSDLNGSGGDWAVKQMAMVATYVPSGSGMGDLCWSSQVPFTQTASCSITPDTVNNCPAKSTVTGYAWGVQD